MNERPKFKVLAPERGKDGKVYYTEVGRAWPLRDKDGCTVRLSALPLGGELLVLPQDTKGEVKS
ncbi:MAG: hypothetical protein GC150_07460 [Rhizobiales bacterium]|nr:hypothetical protein [Hyphomicrobiales bacterium]